MSVSMMRPGSSSTARPTTANSLDAAYSEAEATLLHSAAGQGDRAAIRSFLQTFEIDCTDNQGRTPLMCVTYPSPIAPHHILSEPAFSCACMWYRPFISVLDNLQVRVHSK
jgi:hypothetical protein